jgi:6-phosphogluconolactonase
MGLAASPSRQREFFKMIRAIVLLSLTLAAASTCLFSQVVYVANALSNDVSAYSVDAGTGALTAIPGSPFPAWPVPIGNTFSQSGPAGVAVDPTGKFLYIADPLSGDSSDYISGFTINSASGALTAIPGLPFAVAIYMHLGGVAVDPTGKFLYISNLSSGIVSAYTINASSGALTAVPGSPFESAGGSVAVAMHPTGKFLYVTSVPYNFSGGPGGVSAFTINAGSGALTVVPGSPFSTGPQPESVVVHPTGKFVYVSNESQCATCPPGTISAYSVNASSGALTTIPGSPFPDAGLGPFGTAVDPAGKFLYVSNALGGSVSTYAINAGSGALTAVPGSPFAGGGQPQGVAVDPFGKFLYVANPFSSTISAYTINPTSGALTPTPGSPFAAGKGPVAIAIRSQLIAPSLAITAIAPNSATAGGPAFTLTVTGTGFVSSGAVQWNGSPLATTFTSATQVSAAVPASLIAAAGSASITVSNPGGMASKAVSFTINPVSISISANGVVNAASHAGGAVSPGEIVTILGSNFGPGALVSYQLDGNGFVTTSLGGVQALFDGVAVPLLSAQAGQVTAVVPYEVSGNPSTQLQISYQGQTSSAVAVPVAAAAPGIFTADGSGSGQGLISNEDGTANAPGNVASVGSTVTVYATGEGQTIPAGVDGQPGDPATPPVPILPVTATIGGLDAPVVAAGGISGMTAGYLQVSVQIPQGVTVGDTVPIVLNIGGITSQPNVTLAVQ